MSDKTCDQLYDTYCGLREQAKNLGSPLMQGDPIPRPTEDNPWVRYVLNTLISLLMYEIRMHIGLVS